MGLRHKEDVDCDGRAVDDINIWSLWQKENGSLQAVNVSVQH